MSGNRDRAGKAWRREESFVPVRSKSLKNDVAFSGGQEWIDVLLCELLASKRRWLGRDGLRRRCHLAGHVRLRYRALLDRPQRLSGLAVEDKQEAMLRRLDNNVNVPSLVANGE